MWILWKKKICLQLKSTLMNVSLSHWPLWHQALKLVARVSLLSWHHRGNFALCKIYRRHSFTTSHTCSCSTEKFCLFFLEKPTTVLFWLRFSLSVALEVYFPWQYEEKGKPFSGLKWKKREKTDFLVAVYYIILVSAIKKQSAGYRSKT